VCIVLVLTHCNDFIIGGDLWRSP